MRVYLLKHTGLSTGLSYRFSGFSQSVSWPQENGIRLGMAGAWNFLFRIGACPQIVEENHLHAPEEGDILYVIADAAFPAKTEKALQDWITGGGRVLASGCPEAWRFTFPKDIIFESARLDNPYSALAWLQEGTEPELVAPPQWTYLRVLTNESKSIECRGMLAVISGERQTPKRALISPLEDAPAIIRSGNFIYFNGNPFSAFQAWLQGQENLEPWLAWRHRIFWLDEYAAFIYKILREMKILPEEEKGISTLAKTTVVLKHDLDYSRDTTYLDLETQAKLSGVHSILKDKNTSYWINKLNKSPAHESAFHYNTAIYSRWLEAARSILLNLPKRPYRPNKKAIIDKGLLKQVQWAKEKGIGIKTLHRHASFILYPELLDALDTVYNNEAEVLGSNSYFRAQVLRWGINCADGLSGNYGDPPGPQFPYWFPFRLAHAGYGGRLLRGWETTSIMEGEPALVEQMLNHKIPGITQRVIVLNYHPAHASTATFAKGGCANWFREILNLCHSANVEIRPLFDVYGKLNNYLESVYEK